MNRRRAVLLGVLLLGGNFAVLAGLPPRPTPRKTAPTPARGRATPPAKTPTPGAKTPTPAPGKTPAPTPPPGRIAAPTPTPAPKQFTHGNYVLTVQTGDLERRYLMHVPPRYDGDAPVPLVIVLHGEGSTASNCMRETGWPTKADLAGFLAVFPEAMPPDPTRPARFFGNPQTWNDGSPRLARDPQEVDDIGFIDAMLDDVFDQFNVDKTRVYVTGFSNGGSLAFQLGIELAERITAIAPVAGYLWLKSPKLKAPVSLLYIVGNEDPLVPLRGGEVRLPGGRVETRPPVEQSVRGWVKALGCPPEPRQLRAREGVSAVGHGPGREGSEVLFYTVEGQGHSWPGGKRLMPARIAGPTSTRLRANDVIWDFFRKHTKANLGG